VFVFVEVTLAMEIIPGYPMINFGVATLLYVGVSQRVFALTNDLKVGGAVQLLHSVGIYSCCIQLSHSVKAPGDPTLEPLKCDILVSEILLLLSMG
jgi:hypothetical protein